MRPITRTTLGALAVAAAALATPAIAAASDSYLTFGPVTGAQADARKGHDKWIEVESWSWGATRKGWDGTIKGNATSSAKFGAISGAHRDDSVDARADAALAVPLGAPLERGSVRVKVKFPWLDCRVGAAFPDAVLQNAAGRYELKEVLISGCAADGVALNYAKVTVRGWDPAKKQE